MGFPVPAWDAGSPLALTHRRRLMEKPRKRGRLVAGTGVLSTDWVGRAVGGVRRWALKADHWFYGLFQSAPDLIALLLPSVGAAGASAVPSLGPDSPGDALYRFEAPELKAANHRLDGAFWPRSGEAGTLERPVVLLEVQMHAKPGFKHRLLAQTARFLQLHPQVQYLEVVVVVPHRRLNSKHDATTPSSDRWLTLTEWNGLSDLERKR